MVRKDHAPTHDEAGEVLSNTRGVLAGILPAAQDADCTLRLSHWPPHGPYFCKKKCPANIASIPDE